MKYADTLERLLSPFVCKSNAQAAFHDKRIVGKAHRKIKLGSKRNKTWDSRSKRGPPKLHNCSQGWLVHGPRFPGGTEPTQNVGTLSPSPVSEGPGKLSDWPGDTQQDGSKEATRTMAWQVIISTRTPQVSAQSALSEAFISSGTEPVFASPRRASQFSPPDWQPQKQPRASVCSHRGASRRV